MDVFSLTPLFGLAHEDEWLYVIVHVPVFSSGWLFDTVVVGRDPLPHRDARAGAARGPGDVHRR